MANAISKEASIRTGAQIYIMTLSNFINKFWFYAGLNNVSDKAFKSAFTGFIFRLTQYGKDGKTFNDYCDILAADYEYPAANIKENIKKISKHMQLTANKRYTDYIDSVLGGELARYNYKDLDLMLKISGYMRKKLAAIPRPDGVNPRYVSVVFSGPRPEKLPKGIDNEKLMEALEDEIMSAVDDGYEIFYTGMCKGIDLMAAKCVLKLKESYRRIRLYAAIPYDGFGLTFKPNEQELYNHIRFAADDMVVLSPEYSSGIYRRRNEYMVDHCERAIIVYDGKSGGGTKQTYNYADLLGLDIRLINPEYLL